MWIKIMGMTFETFRWISNMELEDDVTTPRDPGDRSIILKGDPEHSMDWQDCSLVRAAPCILQLNTLISTLRQI